MAALPEDDPAIPARPTKPALGARAAEMHCDVLIVGGGTGGVAAALSCIKLGVSCIIVEPSAWLGGQLTSQGVPPDENQWIESFGGTASFQQLRSMVRGSALAEGARERSAEPFGAFNPGGGWVSRCCAEPARWHTQIVELLRQAEPTASRPMLKVLLECEAIGVTRDAEHLRSVRCADRATGREIVISAKFFLDATETGDVLALGHVPHHIGAEHQSVYGELHGRTDFDAALATHDQLDQQACSWCFAVEHRPGESHTIARPPGYDFWQAHVPQMNPPWCGPLFSWTVPSHNEVGYRTFGMTPWPDEPQPSEWEMWRYRRIVDRSVWPGVLAESHPDVSLINMVQMDYWQSPLLGVTAHLRACALAGAREQSLCWLYWLQTQAPHHDGSSQGYPGLKLRGNELGTADGFAMACYIREPRRLVARTTLTEVDIGTAQRQRDGRDTAEHNWDATPYGTATRFADSVGIGHYSIDLHPSCAGRNNLYVPAAPYQIPMGALIPVSVRNLLAAGKCLGVSHIVNGTTRMHHSEWNIGESAGALASWCVLHRTEPHAVAVQPEQVGAVQSVLAHLGVRLAWPWEQ